MSERYSYFMCDACGNISEEVTEVCCKCVGENVVKQRFCEQRPMKRSEFVRLLAKQSIAMSQENPRALLSRCLATIALGVQDG